VSLFEFMAGLIDPNNESVAANLVSHLHRRD
jgi:hypothetical protein